jgi:hypothetical protein
MITPVTVSVMLCGPPSDWPFFALTKLACGDRVPLGAMSTIWHYGRAAAGTAGRGRGR